jgi:hypothetical protein
MEIVIPGKRSATRNPGFSGISAFLDSGACPGPDPGFAGMTD